ncbi:MAG TPA: MFS transporter [Methylomirabilota bacterium]|nr:MFS transporter [Methylomirabilota bacterium]
MTAIAGSECCNSRPDPKPAYYTVWALIVFAWVTNYVIRMAPGALLPPIMAEFHLNYTVTGFLSAAFFYAYMAMQFPAGAIGDRFGRRRMLVAGLLLGALSSVLTGLAGSFVALFGARLLTGLSQGFLFSNDRVIIAATTPREKMALGQGISFSGPGIGTTLGLLLAGVLGVVMPWRHVFFLFALPPLLAAFLIWRLIPEPPHAVVGAAPAWPFRRVLKSRDFWILGLVGTMPVYVQFTLATWGALIFGEVGVSDLGRSAGLSSLQGLVAPLGLLLAGLLADHLHRRGVGRKLVIALALGLVALSAAGMALVIHAHGPAWLLALFLMSASFFVWCTWGPSYAIFGELFPPSVLGKAFGLYNCVCFIGAIVGPPLTGKVKDLTGSFEGALFLAGALALLCAVLALALSPAWSLKPGPSLAGGRTA